MVKTGFYESDAFFLGKTNTNNTFFEYKRVYYKELYSIKILFKLLLFCIICIICIRKKSIAIENTNFSMYYPLYTQ